MKGEYQRWPYAPDVYSAGLCLLYAVQPDLQQNHYNDVVAGIHNEYRTEEGVKKYLGRTVGWKNKVFPDVLNLLSKVLCSPSLRLTMAEFLRELRKLGDIPLYEGDLPLIHRRK
jgi:hypothetical protein